MPLLWPGVRERERRLSWLMSSRRHGSAWVGWARIRRQSVWLPELRGGVVAVGTRSLQMWQNDRMIHADAFCRHLETWIKFLQFLEFQRNCDLSIGVVLDGHINRVGRVGDEAEM